MKIAVLPGDGIGREVTAQAVQGAEGRARQAQRRWNWWRRRSARPASTPPATRCRTPRSSSRAAADAILFGAAGMPGDEAIPFAMRPGRQPAAAAQGPRPVRQLPAGVPVPRAGRRLDAEAGGGRGPRPDDPARAHRRHLLRRAARHRHQRRAASARRFNTMRYSEPEVERIAHVAFRTARARKRKLCSVDKANVLETMQLWREVVTRVGERVSGRRAHAPVRRRRRDAADARAEAVRRDRHRQHVRRHPLRRGRDADRLDRHAAFGLARRRHARGCTSRCTARRPTSPARTSPIRSPRSCRWR